MSRTGIVVCVVVVLLAAVIVWLLRSPPSTIDRSLTTADLVLTGHRSDGSETWVLEAASGEMATDRQDLTSVQLTFFRIEGTPIVARADQLARTLSGSTLSGGVVVEDGNTRLSTAEMFWDERNDVLEAGAVQFTLGDASLSGDTFRHDLNAGTTTVSGDVAAHLTQDGVAYSAHAASAEAASDRLDLSGDVVVEADSGDAYACGRLTIFEAGDTIELSDTVSGTWQSSTFTADDVRLDAAGVRFRGRVTIDLELPGVDLPS